jgi:hypothetical protein
LRFQPREHIGVEAKRDRCLGRQRLETTVQRIGKIDITADALKGATATGSCAN